MGLDDLQGQLRDFVEKAGDYFSRLSQSERYGWIGEGVGFIMLAIGLGMLLF